MTSVRTINIINSVPRWTFGLNLNAAWKGFDLSLFFNGQFKAYRYFDAYEGAGAVPVAAVLFHKLPVEGKKVACVVSGGNIDVNILNRVITRGLVMSGRKANMTIALEDKPGQLKKVAEIVSRCGSNVKVILSCRVIEYKKVKREISCKF